MGAMGLGTEASWGSPAKVTLFYSQKPVTGGPWNSQDWTLPLQVQRKNSANHNSQKSGARPRRPAVCQNIRTPVPPQSLGREGKSVPASPASQLGLPVLTCPLAGALLTPTARGRAMPSLSACAPTSLCLASPRPAEKWMLLGSSAF